MANANKKDIKVITPECILSYPVFDTPKPDDNGGGPWYSCTLVFLPGSDTKPMKAAVIEAAKQQFPGADVVQMFKDGELKNPFRKDAKKKGYPEGSEFFSCKTKNKPGIVGLAPGADGKPAAYTGEIYPGLRVKASVRPYFYKQQGGGIAMGLGNVQVVGKGERLDSRVAASEEFEADQNAAAAAGISGEEMEDIL